MVECEFMTPNDLKSPIHDCMHITNDSLFSTGTTQAKSIMNRFIGSNPERDFRSAVSTDLPYLPEKNSSRRGSDVVFDPRAAREFVKVRTTKKRVSIKSVKQKIVNIQGNTSIQSCH